MLNYKWKKQLLICCAIFAVLFLLGYLLKFGFLIAIGIILLAVSAVIAERMLRCPECKKSVFKAAMERKVTDFECPECGTKIHME